MNIREIQTLILKNVSKFTEVYEKDGVAGVEPPDDKKLTIIFEKDGELTYNHNVTTEEAGINILIAKRWILTEDLYKTVGEKKNLFCLWDEGTQDFAKKDDSIFTYEAEDYDDADYKLEYMIDKLINDDTLTNEGTMKIELGMVYEVEVDRKLCHKARTIHLEG